MNLKLKFSYATLALVLLLKGNNILAQSQGTYDSLKYIHHYSFGHKLLKITAVPAAFAMTGLIAMTDNDVVDRFQVEEERNKHFAHFRTHADDYLQYAPIVAVYGLSAAGVKARNNFGNRTAILIKSEMIMAALTFSLKKITAVPRPDTGAPTSFPSGHTAQAFAAATFMVKEYGHKNIWYSIGAYSLATSIGVLRVMNGRHWVSDVLVGAGIGIFSTNLAYLTHRYKWNGKSRRTFVMPSYSGNAYGVYLRYSLR